MRPSRLLQQPEGHGTRKGTFRMPHQPTHPTPITPKNGTVTLTGHGLTITIDRGYLTLSDGIADQRREARFHKTDRTLKRLIILGHSGTITLEALTWLDHAKIPLTRIDPDARLTLTSTTRGRDDARLRRAQATATTNGTSLTIARWLITEKLTGQATALGRQPGAADAATRILEARDKLSDAATTDELRILESDAAKRYWDAWSHTPVRFVKRDQARVPEHWRSFGQRISALSGSPRRAINPANALLNYLYAILEAETSIALATLGLDPGIGIMHADQRARDSLALDVMEAARPSVDAFVLETLERYTFRKRDFFETSDGGCRVMPPPSIELAATSPRWAEAVAPVAEHVAQALLDANPDGRAETLATPLTQANRSAGRRGKRARPGPAAKTVLPATCQRCGLATAASDRKYCDACLGIEKREQFEQIKLNGVRRLEKMRQERQDPAQSNTANEKRRHTQSQRIRQRREWEVDHPDTADLGAFNRDVLPRLKGVSLRRIRDATGLSLSYCARIRGGVSVPHAVHWPALRQLTARPRRLLPDEGGDTR
jgi:CRISPR-associated endonuclease Cas1